MSESETTTGCVCPLAGWCERHKMQKHPVWHRNCHTRPEWFALYESGHRHEAAPAILIASSPEPPIEGVGDVLAAIFEKTGVAWFAERAAKLAGLKGCGCKERQQLLNEIAPFKPDGIANRLWAAVIRQAGQQAPE